jgi:tRNA pseudouridine55 synthase
MDQDINNADYVAGEVLLFDKPLDWTSFSVVNKVRYLLCRKLNVKKLKVGHAGTLDPKATGLVVLCTGKATKNIDAIQSDQKEYIATLKLGATTPSFDLESEEDTFFETSHITKELISEALKGFIGEIDQVPPIFSAIKVNGKRAFDYARGGHELEMKARKVLIDKIEIVDFELPLLTLKIVCGKGTYIRSLANDIGQSLGSGAYLIGLRRTRIGNLDVDKAWSIEDFEKHVKQE